MTVIDGGVPAVHSAAEHVHRSRLYIEFIDVDNDDPGLYCKTCMVRWPCQLIANYRKGMRVLYADQSAAEEAEQRAPSQISSRH